METVSRMTPLLIRCCICAVHAPFDWHKRYGMDAACCCKECYEEFDWRRTLSILGKDYYPKPETP